MFPLLAELHQDHILCVRTDKNKKKTHTFNWNILRLFVTSITSDNKCWPPFQLMAAVICVLHLFLYQHIEKLIFFTNEERFMSSVPYFVLSQIIFERISRHTFGLIVPELWLILLSRGWEHHNNSEYNRNKENARMVPVPGTYDFLFPKREGLRQKIVLFNPFFSIYNYDHHSCKITKYFQQYDVKKSLPREFIYYNSKEISLDPWCAFALVTKVTANILKGSVEHLFHIQG